MFMGFGTGVLYIKTLHESKFLENRKSVSLNLSKSVNEFCPRFHIIPSVNWYSYHVHTPTHVQKLCTITNSTYTWNPLHVTRTNSHPTLTLILVHFPMAQQALVGQGLHIFEALRSHSDTPHSVRFLWMSDQPDADTTLTLSQEPSMPPADFEPAIPAAERPQTYTLGRAATGISPLYWGLREHVLLLLQRVAEFIFSTDNF